MQPTRQPRRCTACYAEGHNKNSKKCPQFRLYQAAQQNKKNVPPRPNPEVRPQPPRFVPTAIENLEEDEEEDSEDGIGNVFNFGEWERVDEDEEVFANHLGEVQIEGEFDDQHAGLIRPLAQLSVIDLFMHFIAPFLPLLITTLNGIIVNHNIYSTIVTEAMFFSWIAIYFHMMNFPRPSIAQYWSKLEPDLFVRATKLSRKKFLSIFRAMYHLPVDFLDTVEQSLNAAFCSSWIPSRFVSIDEIMRKFKGRCRHKCYEPSKPTKWGLKYYAMLDGYGWCCRFQRHRAGVKVTLKDLCVNFLSSLDQDLGSYCLFADNYYGSIQLGVELEDMGHKFVFTMRKNRTKNIWQGYERKY